MIAHPDRHRGTISDGFEAFNVEETGRSGRMAWSSAAGLKG